MNEEISQAAKQAGEPYFRGLVFISGVSVGWLALLILVMTGLLDASTKAAYAILGFGIVGMVLFQLGAKASQDATNAEGENE